MLFVLPPPTHPPTPPPPPPKKKCATIFFDFSWHDCNIKKKQQYANFWGVTTKVHYGLYKKWLIQSICLSYPKFNVPSQYCIRAKFGKSRFRVAPNPFSCYRFPNPTLYFGKIPDPRNTFLLFLSFSL